MGKRYEDYTVVELRAKAKKRGITYSGLRKAELIRKLRGKATLPKPSRNNGLRRYGYKSTDPAPRRRRALKRAVKKQNYARIVRRLNLIRNLTYRSNPKFSKKLSADIKWMQSMHRRDKL